MSAGPGHPGSRRRRPLPANWDGVNGLRMQCLLRDGFACRWRMGAGICGQRANQADHVDPDGPDDLANLQALCPFHHNHKTGREGGRAAGALRRKIAAARQRPAEQHPGLRDPKEKP